MSIDSRPDARHGIGSGPAEEESGKSKQGEPAGHTPSAEATRIHEERAGEK
jgi:hypothetical protein